MKSNIAAAINSAHSAVERAKADGTRHAIECGRLLLDAKATVSHGGWDAWVRENCQFSPRTAQLYMRICKAVEADPAKAQRVADLGLKQAGRELASKPSRAGSAVPAKKSAGQAAAEVAQLALRYVPLEKMAHLAEQARLAGAVELSAAIQTARQLEAERRPAGLDEMMEIWASMTPEWRDKFRRSLADEAQRQGVPESQVQFGAQ